VCITTQMDECYWSEECSHSSIAQCPSITKEYTHNGSGFEKSWGQRTIRNNRQNLSSVSGPAEIAQLFDTGIKNSTEKKDDKTLCTLYPY
jgi:hypothetical protein